MSDDAWHKVNCHYREDNCSFHNEYIEKAIHFYTGYLDTQNARAYYHAVEMLAKKFDFSAISAQNLQAVVSALNNRPRKCLAFLPPAECFPLHRLLHLT